MSTTNLQEHISNIQQEILFSPSTGNELRVSPLGALFTLKLHNMPILIPVIRGDGKSIRTHFCSPNFGKDHSDKFSLKQHGNMRNELCKIKQSNSRIIIKHDITDSPHIYPQGVTFGAIIELKDGEGIFTLSHQNNGTTEAPINTGIHCYFNAPESYKNTTVNGFDITKLVENTGNIDLKPVNTIQIPGMPEIILQQSGFSKAVLWVGENEKGIKDSNYICIEPVEFLPEELNQPQTLIQPNQSRTIEYTLKISK